MASIYIRYSPIPIVLSQSYEKTTSRDNNGDLVIPSFPNQWGSYTSSFASSGWISLAAGSGIYLNTPGYVDASGMRVNSMLAQHYSRINANGDIIPLYNGPSGALLYKNTDDIIGVVPNFIYNTGINKLTSPSGTIGSPFYVSAGLDPDIVTHEIAQFTPLELVPELTIPQEGGGSTIIPAEINITAANFFTSNIRIGTGGQPFKDTILTHQGANLPASWMKADYLKAEGALWHRYPKRAIRIEQNRIIFYSTKPGWALIGNTDDYQGFGLPELEKEFGSGDTIAIISAETLEIEYIKAAITVTFAAINTDPDTTFTSPFEAVTLLEPADLVAGTPSQVLHGFAMKICPSSSFVADDIAFVKGYAFSVKKGGYLTMQLEPDATGPWGCATDVSTSYSFKPSTMNTISIRPNIHTAFNMIAENIDFIVYGQRSTLYDNYDGSLFGLNDHNIPSGLIPAFMVDANVPNCVSGTLASGVIFDKYLDRAKSIPTGYHIDETPKVCINTNSPHLISSITSGLNTLSNYAALTVAGTLYSRDILTQEIYLSPKPSIDNSGKYVANALLTLNAAGQIISRKPIINPTIPEKPIDVIVLVLGNGEFSITWTPGHDGGSDIINSTVEFSANSGNTWTLIGAEKILKGLGTQTSCTIIDLESSITYLFRVKTQNSIGISEASDPSVGVQADNTIPQAPKNFIAVRIFGETTSDIELSWTPPDSQGSSAIDGYIIEESDNNGASWIYYNTSLSLISNTNEIIYGLNNELNYLYRVSSMNSQGQGAYNYIYSTGNLISPPSEEIKKTEDVLSNWDFGSILFTGVCLT